jgi:adenylylsulfate kinase-like enzyme
MIKKIENEQSFSLWLIGPSASGKTTVSDQLFNVLKKKYKNLVHLDGDHARKIFLNESGYDPVSRSKNIKKYMSVVSWLNSFGISVIVAAINAFEKDRSFCREELANYKEVYLKCSIEERIKRDKKKLYLPALSGEKKNVVDVDIPFEKPLKAELTIDTENSVPEEIVKKIIEGLNL